MFKVLSQILPICWITQHNKKTIVIFNGKQKQIVIPTDLADVVENDALKLLGDISNMKSDLFYRAMMEEIVWRNLIPNYILVSNGIDTHKYFCVPLKTLRGPLAGLKLNSRFVQILKYILTLSAYLISSVCNRQASSHLFIKESIDGFRYNDILENDRLTYDIATASIRDIWKHAAKILTGNFMFVGIHIPLHLPLRLGRFHLTSDHSIYRLTKALVTAIPSPSYASVKSYDKVNRHFLFIHRCIQQKSRVTFLQHGVIGPLYFNALRRGLFAGKLNFETQFKWSKMKSYTQGKSQTKLVVKAYMFLNEFLCDEKNQDELMGLLVKEGFVVYYKDRPAIDFHSVTSRWQNTCVKLIHDYEECHHSPQEIEAIVFHSSAIYDLLGLGFNVLVVDNYLFAKEELADADIAQTTSQDLIEQLTLNQGA